MNYHALLSKVWVSCSDSQFPGYFCVSKEGPFKPGPFQIAGCNSSGDHEINLVDCKQQFLKTSTTYNKTEKQVFST
jgi:hypothetical protein